MSDGAILGVFYEDDDGLLNYCPFSQQSKESNVEDEKEKYSDDADENDCSTTKHTGSNGIEGAHSAFGTDDAYAQGV